MQSTNFTFAQFEELIRPAQLPIPILNELLDKAESISIAPNTVFSANGTDNSLAGKLFFIHQGYAIDTPPSLKKEAVTCRIIQAPTFTTTSLFSRILNEDPFYERVSITEINGIAWDLDYVMTLADKYPNIYMLFCQALSRILLSHSEIEIVNAQMNSADKYTWFMKNYPNTINQIPLKYIASFLNMRPETLSRVRSEIRQQYAENTK